MVKVFAPGVFDVFHVGHLGYLKQASQAGDHLIVGVQDDRAVRRQKSVDPVIPLADRMTIIEHLCFVDEVISYVDIFQGPLLTGLDVDVLAVGEEYGATELYPDQQRTLDFCQQNGVRVHRIPRTEHVSSTNIRQQLRGFWNSRAKLADDLVSGVTVLGSSQGDQQLTAERTAYEVGLVVNNVQDTDRKTLLDLGCGDGRQLVELAKHFDNVIGVDYAGELLKLAQRKLDAARLEAQLIESDAITFSTDTSVDAILLSGLLPYMDDNQIHQILNNLDNHVRDGVQLFVRTSIGTERRIDVVNQFSQELGARYTAYYRTHAEIVDLFLEHGWRLERSEMLGQHRADSGVKWYEFTANTESQRKRLAA